MTTVTYALSGKWRQDGGNWTTWIDGKKYPLGSSGSHKYDTFFNRPSAFLTDYAGGANYIVSASLKMTRVDSYTQTETIRFAAGSSTAGKVGSYVYYDFPSNSTRRTIPFTAAAQLLVSNAYIIANASGYGSYVEVKASTVDLEVTWAPVNTAPYWNAGSTVNVTGTINSDYAKINTALTASWPACVDDDGNFDHYECITTVKDKNQVVKFSIPYTGTALSTAYTGVTEGDIISFAVRAVDTLGLLSDWIYSSEYIINYAPAIPIIGTINGAAVSEGMTITCSANLVLASIPAHTGGYGSGYTDLQYRQYKPVVGVYGLSSTIALTGLSSYAGKTASVAVQATDGWETVPSSTYTIKVGSSYAAAVLTANTVALDPTTSLTVGITKIDTNYYSTNLEAVTLYYSYDQITWNILSKTSRTAGNNTIISNILSLLNSKDSTIRNAQNKTIYFRVGLTTGHLSSTSATINLLYTAPSIVSAKITKADDSTTFKYPANGTRPITELSFDVELTIARGTHTDDLIATQLSTKIGANGGWVSIHGSSLTGTATVAAFSETFAAFGLTRGQIAYSTAEISSTVNGTKIIHASIDPVWNGTQITGTELRAFSSFPVMLNGVPQGSFIRNESPTNGITIPIAATLETGKGYYVLAKLKIDSTEWQESSPALLSGSIIKNAEVNLSAKSGGTWPVGSFKILNDTTTPIPVETPLSLSDNSTQAVTLTFLVWEAYKNGSGEYIALDPNRAYSTVVLSQVNSNTICPPTFAPGNTISFIRV